MEYKETLRQRYIRLYSWKSMSYIWMQCRRFIHNVAIHNTWFILHIRSSITEAGICVVIRKARFYSAVSAPGGGFVGDGQPQR